MPDHTVQLNYTPDGFTPTPNPIRVKTGHTIHFKLGAGPANGTVRITFQDPQLFSAGHFRTGDEDVRVTGNAARPRKALGMLATSYPFGELPCALRSLFPSTPTPELSRQPRSGD